MMKINSRLRGIFSILLNFKDNTGSSFSSPKSAWAELLKKVMCRAKLGMSD